MERFGFPSRRAISVRSILTFALMVVVTALLWVTFGTQQAKALPFGDDASWSGESIIYADHGYTKTTDYKDTSNTIPAGATVYQTQPIPTPNSSAQRIFIIYFSSGVDPPTATTAKYVEFNYAANKNLSSPQNAKDISLTVKGQESEQSSCSVGGIGWIICPISVFFAEAMDNIFHILAGMIAVQPSVLGDTNNSMYVAWNVMRNIANVAFVIVFLVIIYSQLTNIGVSNYGLKKLVPRLIVAAILVNLSFVISAVAIDISNILGYSIQNVFNVIREDTFNITGDNFAGVNNNPWTAVTAVILGGGGLIGAQYYLAGAGVYFLVPLLLTLALTILIVVVVLAARQAIIVILVILAPLAFVANLLPNTEKWFSKWRDLFMTMLIFFPAFSMVFGGSQLAGQLIIQNAGDNIIMVLFGLAVQIAPLVITPLLFKLSGNLLGRIAQIANNPTKGILDRNKNWAKDKQEMHRNKSLEGNARWYNPGKKLFQAADNGSRNTKSRTELYKLRADNKYHENNKAYQQIHTDMAGAELDKDAIHNRSASHIEHLKTTHGSSLYDRAIKTEASKENLESAQKDTSAHFNRQRIIAGTALNASSNYLEYSSMRLESSDNDKTIYQTRQKLTQGTVLNSAVEALETSKVRVEAKQTQYSTLVDSMKLDRGTALYAAAQNAQSSKDLLESTQVKVQTLFDQERTRVGSSLNLSAVELEGSKTGAQGAKATFETYIATQKVDDANLRVGTLRAEQAKQGQQIAETRLATTIDNFKSGKLDTATMSAAEQRIMEEMQADSIMLSAEKQAGSSAQYEIQRNIADVMTGNGSLTDQMLDVAQGVGGSTARFRAQAQAVKAAKSLDNDALTSNVALLKNSAERAGTNIKRYSSDLLDAVLKGEPMFDSQFITDEMTKAAMQAQAEEKNISLFEKMKGSTNFDQAMVNEIIGLNSTNFKIAGGFGLQDDPTLNIAEYGNNVEQYQHALRVQRISNLANTNPSGLSGLKFGWVANSLAKPSELKQNIQAVLLDVKNGKKPGATDEEQAAGAAAEASLGAAYKTVKGALENKDILDTIRDRESFIRTVEAELARIHGQEPVQPDPVQLNVDADTYASMDLPTENVVDQDLLNSVDDQDDNLGTPTPEQP